MKENTITKIIEYFESNEELFNECIEELDSYNGYLGDDRYYPMDELGELLAGKEIIELLNMVFFGHDAYDKGSQFNLNREYFTFNGYGNLISTNEKDYSLFLDEWTIKEMLKYRNDIYTIGENEELNNLFNELEELEQ